MAISWLRGASAFAVVRALLLQGASATTPRENDISPFHLAAALSTPKVLRLLLAHGAQLEGRTFNGLGNTPLLMAASRLNAPALRWLMENGADASACAQYGHGILDTMADAMILSKLPLAFATRFPSGSTVRDALEVLLDNGTSIVVIQDALIGRLREMKEPLAQELEGWGAAREAAAMSNHLEPPRSLGFHRSRL